MKKKLDENMEIDLTEETSKALKPIRRKDDVEDYLVSLSEMKFMQYMQKITKLRTEARILKCRKRK